MDSAWEPNERFGPIKFGEDVQAYKATLGAILDVATAGYEVPSWIRYEIPGEEIYIDTEDNAVVSVTTCKSCIYKEREIIGLTQEALEELLQCKPDEIGEPVLYDDGEIQTPLEFYALDAQVWVAEGRVVSISVGKYEGE